MSHVVKLKIVVKDLDALAAAAKTLGCELVRGQQTYKWFGESVGDYPIPDGVNVEDLGKCDHAIKISKPNPNAREPYEVGVVKNKDGEGYTLLWDFWGGGYGLRAVIGDEGKSLRQAYSVEVATRAAQKQGLRVTRQNKNGRVILTCQ